MLHQSAESQRIQHFKPKPSAIYIAGSWLNLSKEQTLMLVKHWYLAGLLEEEYFSTTLKYLRFPEKQINHIFRVLNECLSHAPEQFDAEKFCNLFYPDDERYAVIALALFEYFQQNHFSKGDHKEVSMTVCTTYTCEHKDAIEQMAVTFNLLDEVNVTNDVDITLIIGGRTRTHQVYLRRYQFEMERHQLGVPYVFLSTRKLLPDENLSPAEMERLFNLPNSDGDYFTYLREAYLPKYNDYLSAQLGKRIELTELTEGLALFERCRYFSQQDPSFDPVFIYTETPNADDFYPKAIQLALAQGHLPATEGAIAVSSIQPYIQKYVATVRNLSNATVYGYGPSGGVGKPEILVQATAMLIDTNYSTAAREAQRRLAIEAFPLSGLRRISRDKATQLELPESYLTFLAADHQSPTTIDDEIDAANIRKIALVIEKLSLKATELDTRQFINASTELKTICTKLTIAKNDSLSNASTRMRTVNTILTDALNNQTLQTHRGGKQFLVHCLVFLGLMPSVKPENELGFFGRKLRQIIDTNTITQLNECSQSLNEGLRKSSGR